MSFYGSNWVPFIEDVKEDIPTAKLLHHRHLEDICYLNETRTAKVEDTLDGLLRYLMENTEIDRYDLLDQFDVWRKGIVFISAVIGYTVPCLWQTWARLAKEAVDDGDDLSECWELFMAVASESDL